MTIPEFETLILEVKDQIATLTLHRPERMNAFTTTMMNELIAAFDYTDANDDVRAVIVTGSGDRAFCAGADLSSGGDTFNYDSRADGEPEPTVNGVYRDGGGRVSLRIFRSLKPVIAAVNGAAVGVGATMALAMDIRLASDKARFGFVFTRRGITPEACSSWFISKAVGLSTALEWCMTGRLIDATEAHDKGLVRSVHAPEDLYPAAVAIAREIADNTAPVSVAMARQMLWRMSSADHPMDAHCLDSRAIQARGASEDSKEGVNSFLEKRPAHYPNKVSSDMPDFFDWQGEPEFK
ncbi:crotonase/enoyl-CoA hydratase family protein [uncultured Marinobacter sp.]|uniref:crotonase/enoyl-CoA hydratase family protein n=1 Tax=uncultured Marinobacter sp. TaxID=187379 RepID=UPI0030DC7BB4